MNPKSAPQAKKVTSRKDPHYSAMLLLLSVINAGVHLPFFRFAAPTGIVLLLLTLVCLLLSVFHPEKPIQMWNLVLTLGGLSILYGLSAFT